MTNHARNKMTAFSGVLMLPVLEERAKRIFEKFLRSSHQKRNLIDRIKAEGAHISETVVFIQWMFKRAYRRTTLLKIIKENAFFQNMLAEKDAWLFKNRKKLMNKEKRRLLKEQKIKEKEDILIRLFKVNLDKVSK